MAADMKSAGFAKELLASTSLSRLGKADCHKRAAASDTRAPQTLDGSDWKNCTTSPRLAVRRMGGSEARKILP